jgi:hypothetical protein
VIVARRAEGESVMRTWPNTLRTVALVLAAGAGLSSAPAALAQSAPTAGESTEAGPPPERTPSVPERPEAAVAAKAYAVLEQACAGCHQVGRLKGLRPGGRLANILALDELAADPSLIRPGLAFGSRIFDVILSRHAPLVLTPRLIESEKSERDKSGQRDAPPSWPEASDVLAVREWIESLPSRPAAGCSGRQRITPEEAAAEIARTLGEATADQARALRFISLVPQYNTCAEEGELESYRQAVVRLVNALSWTSRVVVPKRIGRDGTILVVDLTDIGWVAAHWERLATLYPLQAGAEPPLAEEVLRLTQTKRPIIRADWFAQTATQSKLYYELVGFPSRLQGLEQILNVNSQRLVARRAGVRVGIEISEVTAGPRILERLPASSGALWRGYDLAPPSKASDGLTAQPVGPDPVEGVERLFKPEAIRVLMPAPNGIPKFGMFDGQGNRIERLPALIEPNGVPPEASVLPCLSCHLSGARGGRDSLRSFAQKDSTPRAVREAILALHSEQTSINVLVAEDQTPVAKALADALIDPQRTVRGVDPLVQLARGYHRGGDLTTIAAEAGRSIAELQHRAAAAQDVKELVLRAHYGPLDRADMLRVLNAGAASNAAGEPGQRGPVEGETPADAPTNGPSSLQIWASAARFKSGDIASFNVRSAADCFLTVIGIDQRNIATVLFPNDFEPNNQIVAGKTITIPAEKAGYQFRLKARGREQVLALCAAQSRTFSGIEHDFERQRFTVLGNWDVFLAEQLAAGAKRAVPPEARNRRQRDKDKEKGDKPEPLSLFSHHARSALAYEIE